MSRSDRVLVAAAGGAVVLALAAVFILLAPAAADGAAQDGDTGLLVATSAPSTAASFGSGNGGAIVVDVEGAVAEPGIRELAAGSRLADAIAAAGGYATDADLAVAAATINLASLLSDGQQVRIPRIGETMAEPGGSSPATAGNGGGTSAGGLVNLNTATPEELEALPGIGAVTVQKIVAARQEQPFTSLDDAVTRGVINRGQLEDIQGLATAA